MTPRFLGVLILAAATSALLPAPAPAQWDVFDSSNYAQNVLQAARALEQINNQIQSLQNQATMLQNMARNLTSLDVSSLDGITGDLQRIGMLMNQAQGIGFDVQSVETIFDQRYPEAYDAGTGIGKLVSDAEARWQDARSAFRQTLQVQSQIAQTVQSDTGKLSELVNASQGAVGSLQAQQATNQLLALSIKQQLQVQSLLAAQGRAEALDAATNAEAEEEGRAAFTTFLGSSNAYSGQ
ncbi:P-type conjugative transfer protein TrbJ [Inquilinus limosus]|uniref:P-type conjugative transfer protein TrbJ n=1 Tax=Inquilinus limosus TaxID=171674 RepID=UPI003F1485FB